MGGCLLAIMAIGAFLSGHWFIGLIMLLLAWSTCDDYR